MLWNRSDFLRFRFRLWESVGSGSRSRQYLAQFSETKKLQKNLPLQNQRQLISQKVGLSIFCDFFISFYVSSGSGVGTGTVMHFGSAYVKGYGSCGSGSGTDFATLIVYPDSNWIRN